jgi:hypothetical protein
MVLVITGRALDRSYGGHLTAKRYKEKGRAEPQRWMVGQDWLTVRRHRRGQFFDNRPSGDVGNRDEASRTFGAEACTS